MIKSVVRPQDYMLSLDVWTSVMSVVTTAIHHHGMRTLMYFDDLLITCNSFDNEQFRDCYWE